MAAYTVQFLTCAGYLAEVTVHANSSADAEHAFRNASTFKILGTADAPITRIRYAGRI